MKKIIILFLLFHLLLNVKGQEFEPLKIIIKVKSEFKEKCSNNNISFLDKKKSTLKYKSLSRKFPEQNLKRKFNSKSNLVDLSAIYELDFENDLDYRKTLNSLKKNKFIEYAEPIAINKLIYTPNDTLNSSQYYLNSIKAFQAWDINKGDTNVVIAIVDTGTDLDHPDLINQLALNHDDPINNLDDDNDGYIDNYYGWNLASNNNNVSFLNQGHGTNVAGIASAEADNTFGISGVGFKCKFLTVRIDRPNGALFNAYSGLKYAADQGADIINCSWGSNFYSEFAKDIVDYATYNKGALVVAGSGNFGNEVPFYPAAYINAIAVGATIEGDAVKQNSNYGNWLNIFAPGDNILTTNAAGEFGSAGGTSMASPVISACAGIVKSHFPNYNAQQIMYKLYTSADNVESISDSKYKDKMGYGKVNLFRALTENTTSGIAFINQKNISTSLFYSDESPIKIAGDFINYLSPSANAIAKITTDAQNISITNSTINLGQLNTLDTVKTGSNPFEFIIISNDRFNDSIEFELTITDNNITTRQYINVVVNRDYLDVNENLISTTISSSGGIGFSGTGSEFGNGFHYKNGDQLLFEGSFAIGNNTDFVADKFRSELGGQDNDFKTTNAVRQENTTSNIFTTQGTFSDENHSNSQDLSIIQTNYILNSDIGKNSIFYVFTITNNGTNTLDSLYAGLFMDWDLGDYTKNLIQTDLNRKMGITLNTDSTLFAGIRILNNNIPFKHYAVDNSPNADPLINSANSFNDEEKFICLSHDRLNAGYLDPNNHGNDVIDVISAGPFNLSADSCISIGVLININEHRDSLNIETDSLQNLYYQLGLNLINKTKVIRPNSISLYPNPSKDILYLGLELTFETNFKIQVFDLHGNMVINQKVKNYNEGVNLISLNTISLFSGMYILKVTGERINLEQKFIVAKP